jgi:hypothetical protein
MKWKLSAVPAWMWVILGFVLLNILSAELYTTVWMDEAQSCAPAANLYYGRGFTSAGCHQHREGFFAEYPPLHALTMACWVKAVGFGIYQVRGFHYLLWAGAVAIFCVGVSRFGWIKSAWGLSLLAALLFLGESVTYNYRSSRYDPLAILIVALCFLAFSWRPPWRYGGIVLAAALMLPAALMLGPIAVGAGALLLLFSRGRLIRELIALGTGMALGLALLYLFLKAVGSWDVFWSHTTGWSNVHYSNVSRWAALPRKVIDGAHNLVLGDKSCVLLWLGLAVVWLRGRKLLPPERARLIGFALAWSFVVPGMILAFYEFQLYYTWTIYVPLIIATVALLEATRWKELGLTAQCLLAGAGLLILGFGLPGRLALECLDLQERNYANVERFVAASVPTNDIVFADFQAFYALERMNVETYYYPYLEVTPQAELDSINCLVIAPEFLPDLTRRIGGRWRKVASYTHENKFRFEFLNRILPPGYLGIPSNARYNLCVYQKVKA